MAGAGYKLFNSGDVLTAAQVNTYLMQQTVMVFADSSARTTALSGVLAEGMVTYLQNTNVVEIYDGAAWVSLDDPNAIQNSIVDAKGDLISATADNTPARLAVGANNTRLVADSAQATGLKWAADTLNTVIDAKGDLLAGTAADTVDRVPVGANNTRLVADSAQTTGVKWVADTQNTVIDAEGDLLVGVSADTLQKLTLGTNGQVLTVDTSVSGKVKWTGFVGVSCTKSATQSTTTATWTAVTFDGEDYDTNAFHSTSTNTSRFTIPTGMGGYYRFNGVIAFAANSTGSRQIRLNKNGGAATYILGQFNNSGGTNEVGSTFNLILNLAAGDYVEVEGLQGSGGALNLTTNCRAQMEFLGV